MTDPRVTRTKEHVLAVAGDLLADEGRQGFSIDAVAKRSGVARTTIYRHWPELGDLLFDTFRAMGHVVPIVETGSVRDDLVALYGALASGFGNSCLGRCMPVLALKASSDVPEYPPTQNVSMARARASSGS